MPETDLAQFKRECAAYHTKVDMLMKAIYGNGQPGLVDEFKDHKGFVRSFYDRWDQREKDKMKYDDEQKWRTTTLISLAVLILGLLAFFGIRAQINHTAFVSVDTPSALAQNSTQNAGANLKPE